MTAQLNITYLPALPFILKTDADTTLTIIQQSGTYLKTLIINNIVCRTSNQHTPSHICNNHRCQEIIHQTFTNQITLGSNIQCITTERPPPPTSET